MYYMLECILCVAILEPFIYKLTALIITKLNHFSVFLNFLRDLMNNISRLGPSDMPFKCSECDFIESIIKFLITNIIMLTLHQYLVYNYNRSSYIMYMVTHENSL